LTLALALPRILLHTLSRARARFFAQYRGQIEGVRQKEQTEILESQLSTKWLYNMNVMLTFENLSQMGWLLQQQYAASAFMHAVSLQGRFLSST